MKSDVTLEELGVEMVDFNEFMRRCLLLIKNPTSEDVQKRMFAIEANKSIGGNSKPLKCTHVTNCTLPGIILLKYVHDSAPDFGCQNHLYMVKKDLVEKPWELFGHPPRNVKYAAWVTKDISPRMIRARLAQLRELT